MKKYMKGVGSPQRILFILLLTVMFGFGYSGCNNWWGGNPQKTDKTSEQKIDQKKDGNTGNTESKKESAGQIENGQSIAIRHIKPALLTNEKHAYGYNFESSLSYLTDGITASSHGVCYNSDSTKLINYCDKKYIDEVLQGNGWKLTDLILRSTATEPEWINTECTIYEVNGRYCVETPVKTDAEGYIMWCFKYRYKEYYIPPEYLRLNLSTPVVDIYPSTFSDPNFVAGDPLPISDAVKRFKPITAAGKKSK